MPSGRGRGLSKKKKKNAESGNPFGQAGNESSMIAALVNHAGVSINPEFARQPVAGNSSTTSTVPAPGYNTQTGNSPCEVAAPSTDFQLAPNMPIHHLLALLSSHPALQNLNAQSHATNVVLENHSSIQNPAFQGPNMISYGTPAGPRFPIPAPSSVLTNAEPIARSSQIPYNAARPVYNYPSQTPSYSSNYSLQSGSAPLNLSRNRQTGTDEDNENLNQASLVQTCAAVDNSERGEAFNARQLVNHIRAANTPPVLSVGLPMRTPTSPTNMIPKTVAFHLLPANVDKPFPLSDVMLYKKDGFGTKLLQIGRMDSAERVRRILDGAFPVVVGHSFYVVTERSHQAGPRKFVFQKDGPPSGFEIYKAPLRNLILYMQPHVTLSESVVRTVTRSPHPEVVWRYVLSTPHIEGVSCGSPPLSCIPPAVVSSNTSKVVPNVSSNSQGPVDYSILRGPESSSRDNLDDRESSNNENSTAISRENVSNKAVRTSLDTPSLQNITCGFYFDPQLHTSHQETSVSKTRTELQYPGIHPVGHRVAPPKQEQRSLINNDDESSEDSMFSELTSPPAMAVAENTPDTVVDVDDTSNSVTSLGNKAMDIISTSSRDKNTSQLSNTPVTETTNFLQETNVGEVQGTSSLVQTSRSPSVFRLTSGQTFPNHESTLQPRQSFLRYPGFLTSGRPSRAIVPVRTSSLSVHFAGTQDQSGAVAERRIPNARRSLQRAATPARSLNNRLRDDAFFDLVDDTLDGYTLESPQGFNLNIIDRDPRRRQIRVKRSTFKNMFLGYYINLGRENMNLQRLLRVTFIGDDGEEEPAADAGGPRGEYISMLRDQLKNGFWEGYPIFDYGENGLLPTKTALLGDNGTLFAVGLAFSDLIFNAGSCIDGISVHLIQALKKMHAGIHPYVENVTVSDLMDEEVVEAFETLSKIASKEILAVPPVDRLNELCMEWNVTIPDGINYRSALHKRNSLVQSYFVGSRVSALWDFYEGLKAGGVMEYLSIYPDKWDTLFPRKGSLVVTAEELMHNIEFRDADGIILSDSDGHEMDMFEIIVRQYITDIAGDSAKVRHFLMCVTGFDVLTPGKIFIEPQPDPLSEQVKISACGKSIAVPAACTLEYFAQAIGLQLDYNRG